MKHLSAMNVVKEVNVDEYTSTHLSRSLTVPKYRDGISYEYNELHLHFYYVADTIKLRRRWSFYAWHTGVPKKDKIQKPRQCC